MDAYSMSVTSAAYKKTSRIYQDLKLVRLHSASTRKLSIMDSVLKVFCTQLKGSSDSQREAVTGGMTEGWRTRSEERPRK
jgi:hypothetical protein